MTPNKPAKQWRRVLVETQWALIKRGRFVKASDGRILFTSNKDYAEYVASAGETVVPIRVTYEIKDNQ